MKIRDLNINDYIWFKAPGSKVSYPAIVTELIYNDDEPLAKLKSNITAMKSEKMQII